MKHKVIRVQLDKTNDELQFIVKSKDSTEFASRFFAEVQEKLNDVLNGKYIKLPFGIRIVKI